MLNIIKNTINRVFASGVDSDASAFITATGLSGTTQKSAITTLVKDLKSSGLWSKMKAVYPMVTDQRNLYQYTEDFTNAVWQKSGISATGDTTTAPNGTSTADTLQNSNTSGYVRQQNLILSAGQYTQSCYFKKNNNNWVAIYTSDGGANYAIAYFNVNTGVVGTTSAIGTFSAASSSIENVGNGWYRCSLTFTKPSTGATEVSTIVPDADNSFSRTVGQNTFAWGGQLETSTLSIYQPILTTPAAFMASQMKYNLKDARDLDAAFRLTWSGGWTYSATGATPNGTNAFANTNLVPNTALTLNSTHLSFYSRTNQAAGNIYEFGVSPDPSDLPLMLLSARFTGDLIRSSQYDYNLTQIYTANADSTGYYSNTRTSVNSHKVYKNGALLATNTVTSIQALPYTQPMYMSAGNFQGTANRFSAKQVAFATIGNGLTDQENQLLNQITEKYQVALSRGVQAAQSFYYNSAYSNEANTYLYSTQITGTTQVSAINTLINGLKANNLWTKMKAVYPFVTDKTLQADMAAQMKFNLVNPQDTDAAFRLAFSGGWTYSTNGAQPNGTNGYADTKLVPSANYANYNSHLSLYSRTDANGGFDMGSETNTFELLIRYSGTFYSRFSGDATYSNPNSLGYYIANTISGIIKGFKNGANVSNTTNANQVVNSYNVYIGAVNSLGSASLYSNRQYSFATIGTGLTDAEAALLYSLVQQYQTDLSRQV
jgi:hypothetical protein